MIQKNCLKLQNVAVVSKVGNKESEKAARDVTKKLLAKKSKVFSISFAPSTLTGEIVNTLDFFANSFFATSRATCSESLLPTLLTTATFCNFKQFF